MAPSIKTPTLNKGKQLGLFVLFSLAATCSEGNRPNPLFDYAPESVSNYVAQDTPDGGPDGGSGAWSWVLGSEQDFNYDDRGRLTSDHRREYVLFDYLELRTLFYTDSGRLTELIEGPGDSLVDPEYIPTVRSRYLYDNSGRLTQATQERNKYNSWQMELYRILSYRSDGRLAGYDACNADGCLSTHVFLYDGADALVAEEIHAAFEKKFREEIAYDSAGRIVRTTYYHAGDNAWVYSFHYEWEYDDQGRLARRVEFLDPDDPYLRYTWYYDAAGRVSEVILAPCEIADDACVPFERWQISFTDSGSSLALEAERPWSMVYYWSWLYYGRPQINRALFN